MDASLLLIAHWNDLEQRSWIENIEVSEARYNPLQWFGPMQSSCSPLRRRAIVLQQDEALRLKSHIKDIGTQIRKSRVHSSSGSQLTGRSEVTQRCKLKVGRSLDCAYTRKRGLDEKDILCRIVE